MSSSPARLFLVPLVVAACGGGSEIPSKYPPLKAGCEVQIFPAAPPYQTDNIGAVSASCEETIPDADCTRTLKDEACKLGADTIWGVNEPTREYGKKKISGRAAHQK